ncbi:hypothetical protein CS063_03075 [Sporanaerobium hydrogeniformans]|uniref:Uncharacterized protein n=2 Tax=Sporanaerobium hydrogeniformans TaxID=3072179 RepID=A0AC61DF83_9FIRM|nr:hypothetical protein CS063_03075 [Sporanaerobium hydrogeniformans]
MEGLTFQEEGVLPTKQVTLTRGSGNYYWSGNIYQTLQEAQQEAEVLGSGAVAGYIDTYTYGVFSKEKLEGFFQVDKPSTLIEIYDEGQKLILISYNNEVPLVFQGASKGNEIALTQVGSSRVYRGAIGVVNGQNSGLTPYNQVGMEEYLYGVVPCEMGASYPIEALKAQAVVARSIANFQYNRYSSKGYNLVDTTASQVYRGYGAENVITTQAVDETKGELALYNGQVAETVYFSTSGGVTEDAQYTWGNVVPYLIAVSDFLETEPAQTAWTRKITLSEVQACLNAQGVNIGQALGIEIVSRTPAGRVLEMRVIGTNGSKSYKNENIRSFFSSTKEGSLKSRLFSFQTFTIIGGQTAPPASEEEKTDLVIMGASSLGQGSLSDLMLMSARDMVEAPEQLVLLSKEGITLVGGTNDKGSNTSATLGGSIKHNLPATEVQMGDLIIYGQGFGHGVGMSQSGAKGMAKAGYNYREIIEYYYTGVRVGH